MSTLVVEREDTVTVLRMNRPERANSLSAELVDELTRAIDMASGDGTRTLIIRGEGRSFCSGFDLEGIETQTDQDVAQRVLNVESMLQSLHHASILTVALVHGQAFGAGTDLVCACRRRIATPGTKFCMPGLNFGILLGTRRLANCIGHTHAQDLLVDTRIFGAEEALKIGFLTEVADFTEWPDLIEKYRQAGTKVNQEYVARMYEVTTPDTREADMRELRESVSTPGLVQRIIEYRDQMRMQAGKYGA